MPKKPLSFSKAKIGKSKVSNPIGGNAWARWGAPSEIVEPPPMPETSLIRRPQMGLSGVEQSLVKSGEQGLVKSGGSQGLVRSFPKGSGSFSSNIIDGEILGEGGGFLDKLKGIGSKVMGSRAASLAGKGMRGLGILGGAVTAGEVLGNVRKHMLPEGQYTPTDTGAAIYDWLANKVKGAGSSGELHASELPKIEEPKNKDIPDGQDMPELMELYPAHKSVDDTGYSKGGVKTAQPKKKSLLHLAPKKGLAQQFNGGIPDANEMSPLAPLETAKMDEHDIRSDALPNHISLAGGKEHNAPVANPDSMYPDTQDNAKPQSAMDKYRDLVSHMPDGEKPSILRRIIAGMAGASEGYRGGASRGFAASSGIINEPSENAMRDWQTQLGELEPLAKMESAQQINNDKIAQQRRRDDLINKTKTESNTIMRLNVAGRHEEAMKKLDLIEQRNAALGRKLIDGGDGVMHWVDANDGSEEKTDIPSLAYEKMKAAQQAAQQRNAVAQQNANTHALDVSSKIGDRTADNARADSKQNTNAGPKNPESILKPARSNSTFDVAREMGIPPDEVNAALYAPPDESDPEGTARNQQIKQKFNSYMYRRLKQANINPEVYGYKGDINLPAGR